MPNPLCGQVALVTGGAKRVGRAIALRLAQEGMDIAFTFHTSATEAQATTHQIKQLGRRVHAIKVDLATPNAADHVHEMFGFDRLDALINNASSFSPSPLGEITSHGFAHHMSINALAPLLLVQKFALMLSTPSQHDSNQGHVAGRVVNLLDVHVLGQPLQNHVAYNASKAALLEITKTCAIELAPHVTVNAIAPGVVAWPESSSAEFRQKYTSRVPLARHGDPADVAAAVLFLVRDAGFCTGQIIAVDGGRLLV